MWAARRRRRQQAAAGGSWADIPPRRGEDLIIICTTDTAPKAPPLRRGCQAPAGEAASRPSSPLRRAIGALRAPWRFLRLRRPMEAAPGLLRRPGASWRLPRLSGRRLRVLGAFHGAPTRSRGPIGQRGGPASGAGEGGPISAARRARAPATAHPPERSIAPRAPCRRGSQQPICRGRLRGDVEPAERGAESARPPRPERKRASRPQPQRLWRVTDIDPQKARWRRAAQQARPGTATGWQALLGLSCSARLRVAPGRVRQRVPVAFRPGDPLPAPSGG